MEWICNNMSQYIKLEKFLYIDLIIIEFILSPVKGELEFKYENKLIFKFNDVKCFKSEFF